MTTRRRYISESVQSRAQLGPLVMSAPTPPEATASPKPVLLIATTPVPEADADPMIARAPEMVSAWIAVPASAETSSVVALVYEFWISSTAPVVVAFASTVVLRTSPD